MDLNEIIISTHDRSQSVMLVNFHDNWCLLIDAQCIWPYFFWNKKGYKNLTKSYLIIAYDTNELSQWVGCEIYIMHLNIQKFI